MILYIVHLLSYNLIWRNCREELSKSVDELCILNGFDSESQFHLPSLLVPWVFLFPCSQRAWFPERPLMCVLWHPLRWRATTFPLKWSSFVPSFSSPSSSLLWILPWTFHPLQQCLSSFAAASVRKFLSTDCFECWTTKTVVSHLASTECPPNSRVVLIDRPWIRWTGFPDKWKGNKCFLIFTKNLAFLVPFIVLVNTWY